MIILGEKILDEIQRVEVLLELLNLVNSINDDGELMSKEMIASEIIMIVKRTRLYELSYFHSLSEEDLLSFKR